MRRANATGKITADGLNPRWARSNRLAIAAATQAETESAAQRALQAAGKRVNAVRNCGAQAAYAVAVERGKLRVEVVDLKPQHERRVPPVEVRRAEHGFLSKRFHLAQTIEAASDGNMK
jgi:hypothetical protein